MSKAWGNGSTRAWRQLRAWVLARDNHQCQIRLPGCTGHANHADNIVPKSKGGTDHPGNLRASCAACNIARGATYDPDPPCRPITRW